MKRGLILVLAGFLAWGLGAEDLPGAYSTQLGVGPSTSESVHGQAGADARLVRLFPAPSVPLDAGVALRAGLQGSVPDVGVLATLRYHWKSLDQKWEWLDAWDTYAGLGVQILPALGGAALLGVAFHADAHWGAFAEASSLPWPLLVGVFYIF